MDGCVALFLLYFGGNGAELEARRRLEIHNLFPVRLRSGLFDSSLLREQKHGVGKLRDITWGKGADASGDFE